MTSPNVCTSNSDSIKTSKSLDSNNNLIKKDSAEQFMGTSRQPSECSGQSKQSKYSKRDSRGDDAFSRLPKRKNIFKSSLGKIEVGELSS